MKANGSPATAPNTTAIASLRNVSRVYGAGPTEIRALDSIDLAIREGEFVVLLGPSGSGKTTLLNVIGGIDSPTSGTVTIDGQALAGLDPRSLTRFRRDHVAFIFQFYNLVPTLTAMENVELIAALRDSATSAADAPSTPKRLARWARRLRGRSTRPDRAHQASSDALTAVGLGDQLDRFPSALSGGQQQRVAVARALAKNSPLFLCDEPTGALDQAAGGQVLDLLQDLNREQHRTLIIVTHDESIAKRASRVIRMLDGKVLSDTGR